METERRVRVCSCAHTCAGERIQTQTKAILNMMMVNYKIRNNCRLYQLLLLSRSVFTQHM